ncbi:hypothetical protein EJ06DRAFT_533000 [Trichodelitschia bisporula]|uniref:Uncharacterized protein n=1 Tax=Trichodelitschia bisporula TaxID=703511 RepID=A0A6G1HNE8_9PEZI|nr:hypothetical protein EJ06DRAFT_533000 [Trichodelitschia bisporula]
MSKFADNVTADTGTSHSSTKFNAVIGMKLGRAVHQARNRLSFHLRCTHQGAGWT